MFPFDPFFPFLVYFQYAVVDAHWYRNLDGYDSIDDYGRPIPDIDRWPSSADGKGFSVVSETLHNWGLKFGIHVVAGMSHHAMDSNTPILDVTTVDTQLFLLLSIKFSTNC